MPTTRSRQRTAARPSSRGGAGRPGPRPPAPTRRRWPGWAATAAGVLVAAVVALVLVVTRPWEPAPEPPGGITADPARVAELAAAEEERNAENLTAAAELAVSAQERLLPVMDGLYEALPVDDGTGTADPADVTPPTSADLRGWRDVVQEVESDVEALPPGSSEHNIVRNGLLLSTGLLGDTLDVLAVAGTGAPDDSERLYGVAGDLRTRAVDAWSQAAVQLDMQHIAADRGHLHAFLPLHSGMSTQGEAALGHPDH